MTSAFCNWIGYKLKKMKFRKIIYLTQQIWLMDHKVHIFAINSNPSPYKYTCCSGFVINIYIPHLWQAPSLLSWNDYVNWSLIDQMNRIPFFWYCFNYFFLYCCAGWGYVVAFTKVLTMIKYIIFEFIPFTSLFYPPFLDINPLMREKHSLPYHFTREQAFSNSQSWKSTFQQMNLGDTMGS
jgi:hypothetical protein